MSVPSEHVSAVEARIYAYGVVRASGWELGTAAPIHGVSGSAVRALAHDGLVALVSDLPLGKDTAIDEIWQDAERIESMALDHHRVLQCVAEDHTVLPLRFGAVFSDDCAVAAALAEYRQALWQGLEHVAGAREWGIKIFCDHNVLRPHLSRDSDAIRVAHERIAAISEGRAFFLRRHLERLVEKEIRQAVMRCVVESAELLSAATRSTATLNIHPRSIHGRTDDMVWNAACLVARDREDRFFATIDTLREVYRRTGFHYEHSGPWAPCSFTELSCPEAGDTYSGACAGTPEARP
jgi:hypothetical protein